MARSTAEKEEKKLTLPAGHPDGAYVGPDLSFQDDTGTLPDEEQEWHDARDDAHEAEVEAAAEHEDKVVRAALAEQEKAAKDAEKEEKKADSTSSSSSAKTS